MPALRAGAALLNAFYGEHRAKGWQVLGLAIDQPANVQKFPQRMPLDFPVVLGGLGEPSCRVVWATTREGCHLR